MWVRKTTEEIAALPKDSRAYRLDPFVPIVVAAILTGLAILNTSTPPAPAAFLFFAVFLLACNAQAHVHDMFFGDLNSRVDYLDPESHLFCPDCRLLRSHLALCPDCRGPLEPMAHWKWVETPNRQPPVAPLPSAPLATAASGSETSIPTPTREIGITLPIARRKLAAQIGITHSRLLKDLLDQDLFAAVNPRLADRNGLAHLGRKYCVTVKIEV